MTHAVTDYRMARRSVLESFRTGTIARDEICDAQPELLRVAKHQGRSLETSCPVCDAHSPVIVAFAFGERLKSRNGAMVDEAEIPKYLNIQDVRCYSGEVCTACSWNHIRQAFVVHDVSPNEAQSSSRPPS